MIPVILRPDQCAMRDQALAFIQRQEHPIIEGKTGSGKTTVGMAIIKRLLEAGLRVAWLAHRIELIEQASARATLFGLPHRVVLPETDVCADRFHIASIDTLRARLSRIGSWLESIDVVIIDEGHHVVAPGWKAVVLAMINAVRVALTATPYRLDGKGLGDGGLFTAVVRGASYRDLVAIGALCPVDVYAPQAPLDVSGVRVRMGDYVQSDLERAVNTDAVTIAAVRSYARHAAGAKAAAFCVTVQHAKDVATAFTAAGWNAVSVDGSMSGDERRDAVRGLARGRYQIITSCNLISEGWDVPGLEVAILLRPTKSTALYQQQVGRAGRAAAGKAAAIVLDMVGNVAEHGMPDAARPWTLQGGIKGMERSVPATVRCRRCSRVVEVGPDECPSCRSALPKGGGIGAGPLFSRPAGPPVLGPLNAAQVRSLSLNTVMQHVRTAADVHTVASIRDYKRGWISHVLAERPDLVRAQQAQRRAG